MAVSTRRSNPGRIEPEGRRINGENAGGEELARGAAGFARAHILIG